MRRIGAFGVVAIAASLATVTTGCKTVQPPFRPDPGVTGYAFVRGYSVQRYVFPLPLVERAAIEAMTDMKMTAMKRTVKDDGVAFCGLTYDGRAMLVAIENDDGTSIVSSRVDAYGDEPLSKVFNDRIGIRLSTLPQSLNPPFDPRNISDSITHRGMPVEGYRGAPLR